MPLGFRHAWVLVNRLRKALAPSDNLILGCVHTQMATLPRNQCCQSQKIKTCRVPSKVARCHSPPYMLPSAWKQVNFDVRGARGVCPGCCAMPPVLLMSLHRLWLSRFNLACLPQNRTGFLAAFAAVLPMVSR